MHDKGEQYYLHYDFWPNVPYIHESKPKEYSMDMVITKELEIEAEIDGSCMDGSYNYFGEFFKLASMTCHNTS